MPSIARPFLGVLGLTLLLVACSDDDGQDQAAPAADSTTTTRAERPVRAPVTTTTQALPVSPLTGAEISFGQPLVTRPALVVKVDNSPKALGKQAGLNAADIVYVEQVEGGATRLALVFQSIDADVGPVRSARTSDIGITADLNRPLFAYSGANGGVLRIVGAASLVDVGWDTRRDRYSTRGSGLLRIFAATNRLYELAPADAGPPPALFAYRKAGEVVASAGAEDVKGVNLDYSGGVRTTVAYVGGLAGWGRAQNGVPHTDDQGQPVAPANVVIQFTRYKDSGFRDVTGAVSPEAILTGEGDVWVLTGGKLVRGRWARPFPGGVTVYTDSAGDPIPLATGRTWIELVPPGRASVVAA